MTFHNFTSEQPVINYGTQNECNYLNFEINDKLVNWIPELNHYLMLFLNPGALKIVNPKETVEIMLQRNLLSAFRR